MLTSDNPNDKIIDVLRVNDYITAEGHFRILVVTVKIAPTPITPPAKRIAY